MQLNPGSRAEYERRHNPIWAELQATLKSHGAHNYSIFHDARSDQLFAYVEIEDETRWQQIAETEVCRRWWTYMRDLMATNADASPVAIELAEVFHLA